jgi:predicted DNA binding protein
LGYSCSGFISFGDEIEGMISNGLTVGFQVTEDDSPLERVTERTGTDVHCCPPPQLRRDGNVLLRFRTRDDGEAIAEHLLGDDRVSHVFHSCEGTRDGVRCLSEKPSSLHTLTNAGFLPTTVRYVDGTGFFRGEVVGRDVLKNVLQAAGSTIGIHVRNIYRIEEDPEDAASSVATPDRWDLTPAQEEALETAYRMGYFEMPRAATTAGIAAELDISKSALLQRLQRAERAIVGKLFDDKLIS